MNSEKIRTQAEIQKHIESIDALTEQITSFEQSLEAPKSQYLQDITEKTKQIGVLTNQLNKRQQELASMDLELERYKIQIAALNDKISELECNCIELKVRKDHD